MSVSAHPLAIQLAQECPRGAVLLLGIGSGRNLSPFFSRPDTVTTVDPDPQKIAAAQALLPANGRIRLVEAAWDRLPFADASFAGILSTHVLQHGTRQEVTRVIAELARVAADGAICNVVFASVRDARFGQGELIAEDCWAPAHGDEIGVPHFYTGRAGIMELIDSYFAVRDLREFDADALAGSWAHTAPSGLVHWFLRGRRKART